jgi:predicted membrane-bound spermidine synthase
MLVDHWAAGDPDRAGKAYAVNVLGCILGPLLAGFYLLPRLGERWALVALTLPLFVFGALATRHKQQAAAQPGPNRNGKLYYALAMVAALLVVMATRGYEALFPKRVVLRDDTATVLASGVGLDKDLLVNGIGMTYMTPITKYMAHLPLAFMQRPPKNGLVVCFGMGTTFRSMLSWGIPTTVVDLVPSVPALFGYFHTDAERLLASPLAQIVVDDGRRFLDGSTLRYDVITVDPPPPPAAPGSSLLYSRQFYAIVKRHLAAGGIVQLWYPEDETDPATSASIAKALVQSFPYVRAFQSVEGWGIHYLASMEALSSEPASVLAARLPASAVADLVEWGPGSTAEEQLSDVLAHEQEVGKIIALDSEVPPLEDDQPINEYFALRQWFQYYR